MVVDICTQPLVKNCSRQVPGILSVWFFDTSDYALECKKEYRTSCYTSKEEHQVEEDVPHCVVEEEEKCEEATTGYVTGERCMTWPVTKCKLVKKIVTKYTPNTKVKPTV